MRRTLRRHVERHRDVRGFQRRDRRSQGVHRPILMQVKDGVVYGEHGSDGTPGWLRFDGRIQTDGSSEIQARGLTGSPEYSVDRVAKSTPYRYRVKAQFEATRGTGGRRDVRPCTVVFLKQ